MRSINSYIKWLLFLIPLGLTLIFLLPKRLNGCYHQGNEQLCIKGKKAFWNSLEWEVERDGNKIFLSYLYEGNKVAFIGELTEKDGEDGIFMSHSGKFFIRE